MFPRSTRKIYKIVSPCLHNTPTMDIKTFVFMDCETTGLPALEYNRTKITELCFTVIESNHINLGVFPRVQNKLNLCFNPGKLINPMASSITGLYNDMLEHQSEFKSETVLIIKQFLDLHRKPLCLVAHNGKNFDYPILRAHISKTENEFPDDIVCIDSLQAFRELHLEEQTVSVEESLLVENSPVMDQTPCEFGDGFDQELLEITERVDAELGNSKLSVAEIQRINETTPKKKTNIKPAKSATVILKANKTIKKPENLTKKRLNYGVSFKLTELYTRLTKNQPTDAHRADCDVSMLIECAATLGQRFTNWANANAVKFSEMPILTSGKKK